MRQSSPADSTSLGEPRDLLEVPRPDPAGPDDDRNDYVFDEAEQGHSRSAPDWNVWVAPPHLHLALRCLRSLLSKACLRLDSLAAVAMSDCAMSSLSWKRRQRREQRIQAGLSRISVNCPARGTCLPSGSQRRLGGVGLAIH